MKPCIIIKGLHTEIEEFENKIALAIEQGYEISGDLITHVINNGDEDIIVLLQPMSLVDEKYDETENF
ncbi:MAG: hypothetical protein KDH96_00985 [Candidatus Riesia sp.]|nr:hypothetical protein [Candidatus Riesia sp.]